MLALRLVPCQPPRQQCSHTAWPALKSGPVVSKTPLRVCALASRTVEVPNPQGPGYPAFTAALQILPNAEVYHVSLHKPLGLTLTEKDGIILVDEIAPEGNAARAGVNKGDALLATTARAQTSSGSASDLVLFKTAGESFKTVTAALRSNTCSQCSINLVLQRSMD